MTRPWTPAPWTLTLGPAYSGSRATYEINVPELRGAFLTDEHYYPVAPERIEDAQLICLAPEMAEAILGVAGWIEKTPLAFGDRWRDGFVQLAEKLNAIGGAA